ncbi:amidohydrolase [Noviherbaspirillum sedimenti]|uniref:Amidohydrolase n=1 Tax=Noviherbaspirillum sedimenti TaxID=2320865 RepID=A0A3A3G9I5_9BURK|nr:amidohydrolase [Noviherbaspirillum sedimenti]
MDCWVNTNLGAPEGDANYLFPGLAERWARGTTLSQLCDEMDAAGIEKAVLVSGYGTGDTLSWVKDAVNRFPERFAASHIIDPRQGMDAVRLVDSLVRNDGYRLIRMMALMTQKPYDDAIYFPIYSKCAELGVPVSVNVGFPGPRVPSKCQDPFALDEVCHFFPELKIIMAHGGEPWTDLCVKLMLKWPNLFYMTSAFAPKHIPAAIIRYLNTRGADRIMWASDYPVLTFERCMKEIAGLEIRDEETLAKFVAENARKLFFSA